MKCNKPYYDLLGIVVYLPHDVAVHVLLLHGASKHLILLVPHIPRQEPLHQRLLVLSEGRHNEGQGQEAELVTQGQQEKV